MTTTPITTGDHNLVIPGQATSDISPKQLARLAGVLYLLVGIFGGFAQGFVYTKVYIAGDAAGTANNLVVHSGLVRAGILADVFQATVWVLVAMALYRLLKHVSRNMAGAMVVLAAMGATITLLNAVFEFEALRVATGGVQVDSGLASSNTLALLLVDTHHFGLVIAQIFFGLWLVPMGILVYKSGWFPKPLGVLLVVGGSCYLLNTIASLLSPDFGKQINGFLAIPSTVAELWMVGYLLIVGVNTTEPNQEVPPARPNLGEVSGERSSSHPQTSEAGSS